MICVGFEFAFVALAVVALTSNRRVPLLAGLVATSLVMLHVWIVDHADGPFGGLEAP